MFEFTSEEEKKTIESFFENQNGPILINMPSKQKKKYIVLTHIAKQFEVGKKYNEKAVNEILKPIYYDYVMLRRYLVDYKLLNRESDGSQYWLNK